MKKSLFLINIAWIALVIVIAVVALGSYKNKNKELSGLQDVLKKSTDKLEQLEGEVKDIAFKKASFEEQNKILIEQLNNAKKDIIASETRKDDKDKYVDDLKEENVVLKKELQNTKGAVEKKLSTEKERFEKELESAKEGYVSKLKDVVQQIEDLKRKSDFLAQKKDVLENVIIQAMADVGKEKMKLYHYQRGLSYEYNKKYEDAIEEYKAVLKIDPNNPDTYLQLAGIYAYKINDLEKAEMYAKEYAKLKPQFKISAEDAQGRDVKLSLPYLKEKLTDVALKNVNLETKIADMKKIVKKKQELANNLHDIAKRNKIVTHKLKQIENKVKKETLKFHYNLAVMYDRNGDYKNACKEYLESLKVSSNDADTHYNLAIVYDDHLNDKKKAIEHYQKYLELCPASGDAKKVEYWIVRAKDEMKDSDKERLF